MTTTLPSIEYADVVRDNYRRLRREAEQRYELLLHLRLKSVEEEVLRKYQEELSLLKEREAQELSTVLPL